MINPSLDIFNMLKTLNLSQEDIIQDMFISGVQFERAKKQKKDNKIIQQELTDAFFTIYNLIEAGVLNKNKKNMLYSIFLDNPTLDFPQFINKEINQLLEYSDQSQIPQGEDQATKKLIQQMLEEEKKEKEEQEKIRKQEKLAKLLSDQFEVERQVQIQKKDRQENKQKECPICLEEIQYEDLWPLRCQDLFHRECLFQYFKQQIFERKFPLKCPQVQCSREVDYQDILEILDEELIIKHNEYSLNQYIDMNNKEISWCPTPDCNFAFYFEENDTVLNCPECNKNYCLRCRVLYHENMSCEEYKSQVGDLDQQFMNFVKGSKCKQCPNCKFWVEKSEGCDHMTCRCGFEFCYACGGLYGKCFCMDENGQYREIQYYAPQQQQQQQQNPDPDRKHKQKIKAKQQVQKLKKYLKLKKNK